METLKTLEFDLSEVETVENAIQKVLKDDGFNSINNLLSSNYTKCDNDLLKISGVNGNLEFISVDINALAPYSNLLSEKEFFKIVGLTKAGLSKRSGNYQQKLYLNYLEAKENKDEGYISDILNKAIVFRNNLNYIKSLCKKPAFMKEWRKNFGNESPVKLFKNTGCLRQINIITNTIE